MSEMIFSNFAYPGSHMTLNRKTSFMARFDAFDYDPCTRAAHDGQQPDER